MYGSGPSNRRNGRSYAPAAGVYGAALATRQRHADGWGGQRERSLSGVARSLGLSRALGSGHDRGGSDERLAGGKACSGDLLGTRSPLPPSVGANVGGRGTR